MSHRASAAIIAATASLGRTSTIADPVQVALIALALSAAMPCEVREIETDRLIETVAEYLDTSIGPMAAYGLAPMSETPGPGELLVFLWLAEDGTGVEVLPQDEPVGQVPDGACGKFITWGD